MDQAELLKKIAGVLESLGISYMIVGSYGSSAWGEPRFTRDIAGILKVSGEDIDMTYIRKWAGDFGLSDIWQSILDRVK